VDTTLKQRLIGAAVLVALAVIFLPPLIKGPAPDSGVDDIAMRVPDAPGGEYETRELPLLGGDAGQEPQPAPVAAAAPAAEATAATEPQAGAGTAAGRWAVSFGAYASERDAEAVLTRVRQAGLEGFIEEATINGRQAWRVRVGPYPDRALAEAGRLQAIRIRNDVNAQVIALDAQTEAEAASTRPAPQPERTAQDRTPERATPAPAATTSTAAAPKPAATAPAQAQPRAPATASTPAKTSAPAPAASAPATPAAANVGFAVQLGAFASAAEANALRDRLRGAGFSAIVQPVGTDRGTLNRVRVGPVASRAEAEQLKARLAAGNFGTGMVVSHP
jgi:Uncharacterized protein conserved in bacteria